MKDTLRYLLISLAKRANPDRVEANNHWYYDNGPLIGTNCFICNKVILQSESNFYEVWKQAVDAHGKYHLKNSNLLSFL